MSTKRRSLSYPMPNPSFPWRAAVFGSLAFVLAAVVGVEYVPRVLTLYQGFVSPPPPVLEPVPAHLVVLLDVSTSLSPADIQSGADTAFRYIKSDAFPRGDFTVYVMDGDVEKNYFVNGNKGAATSPKEIDARDIVLTNKQTEVVDRVNEYIQKNTKRNTTCLMTALVAVPRLLHAGIADQRVLFVSDMVEDCDNKGNPGTKGEMADRIAAAARAHKDDLPVLNGVRVLAAVPKDQQLVPIDWVRKPWTKVLLSRGAPDFQIGVIEQLIQQPNPLNSQARP